MKTLWTTIMMTALCLCLALPAGAAEKFPNRPITLLINYAGGGGTDTSARILSKNAEKFLGGTPITLINKPGGQATTAIIELKNKKADGYTIGIGSYAPMTIMTHLLDVPFTPEDFDYILGYGVYLYCIAVKNDSPIKTIADIKKVAAEKGGQLSFAAAGYPHPITMYKFGEMLGVKFNHVSVKGSAEAVAQTMGGHVDILSIIPGDVLPFVKSGEIRLLGTCSPERLPMTPDTPTFLEQGYDLQAISRITLCTPKGVPADRLEILREAYKKAFNEPEFQQVMSRLNMPAEYTDGEQTKKDIVAMWKKNGEDLKAMGVTVQR